MVDDPVYDVMKESVFEFAKHILRLLDQFTDIRPVRGVGQLWIASAHRPNKPPV
jgi:hypothetical protein